MQTQFSPQAPMSPMLPHPQIAPQPSTQNHQRRRADMVIYFDGTTCAFLLAAFVVVVASIAAPAITILLRLLAG